MLQNTNSMQELNIVQIIEEILASLENLLNRFRSKIDDFPLVQYDHFNSVRREIDIKRETLLDEILRAKTNENTNSNSRLDSINKSSIDLIEQVDNIEVEFRSNFARIKPSLIETIENTSKERYDIKKLLNGSNLCTQEYLEDQKIYYENILRETQRKFDNFKLLEYDLMRNRFVPSSNSTHLGIVNLHFNFIKSIDQNDILNIVTCSFDSKDLYLMNLNTNSILKRFAGHRQGVECFVLNEKNNQLFSGSADCTIKVFDLCTGECLRTLHGHTKKVWSLKLVKDESLLVSGSLDKTIIVWNLTSFKSLFTLKGHRESVYCLDYSMTSSQLISGSEDACVRIWNLQSGTCMRILQSHSDTIRCLKTGFSVKNKNVLASGSSDKTIRIWNELNGKCEMLLKGHTDWVSGLEFLTCQNRLISCSEDRTIRLWNMNDGNCTKILYGHIDYVNCIRSYQKSPTVPAQLISASRDHGVKIWNLSKDQEKCIQTYQMEYGVWRLEICSIF